MEALFNRRSRLVEQARLEIRGRRSALSGLGSQEFLKQFALALGALGEDEQHFGESIGWVSEGGRALRTTEWSEAARAKSQRVSSI